MIRAQAMQDHTRTTGHEVIAVEGVATCSECPWQYPPAESVPGTADLLGALQESVDRARAGRTAVVEAEHVHDTACAEGTLYCPTRDYEANPIDPPDDETELLAQSQAMVEDLADQPTENGDPGPVPDDPPTEPPLDLKARIANLIDVYFGMQDGNPGLPNAAAAADLTDAIHKVVAAGADFTEREEAVEMTPAQALAYLLDLPEWGRIARLGMLLEQARKGSTCFVADHEGMREEFMALRKQRDRLHYAMMQIARITSTIDQPESVGQSVIGSISAEALVPE